MQKDLTNSFRKIELLAPAKNAGCGIEAINHGADAVYIGASKFGARASAGNSLSDIERLVKHAHLYYARVYVTLNTILTDQELVEAEKLIRELYQIGVDALIVQDMGILQLDLPPLPLHASTQTDNRTVEKVQFLEKAGFTQIVLARELELRQIREIAANTTAKLEFFVHGALCVSYSGQCYISEALSGRSANRGECAQFCRLPYDLVDANGQILAKNKHLLSLKDYNLSDRLRELLDAGITSLKIEGRLKDISYVKNVTAFYRRQLDAILGETDLYGKASSGSVTHFFVPEPQKSFHRGATHYFLDGRTKGIESFETPKSIGEKLGKVKEVGRHYLIIDTAETIHNGDGLVFFKQDELTGFRVNSTEGKRIFPAQMPDIQQGAYVYRNFDHEFEKIVSKESAKRKISVDFSITEVENGFLAGIKDEDGNEISELFDYPKEMANNSEAAEQTIRAQFRKLGNTPFETGDVKLLFARIPFVPASELNAWRRTLVERLEVARIAAYPGETKMLKPSFHPYPESGISYLGNVYNQKAYGFYRQHGVEAIAPAFEQQQPKEVPVMFCKHCIKYSLQLCPKEKNPGKSFSEPLFLIQKHHTLQLVFDCERCEMRVIK